MANESTQPDSDTSESMYPVPGLSAIPCPQCGNLTLQTRADLAVWCTFDNAFISVDRINQFRALTGE